MAHSIAEDEAATPGEATVDAAALEAENAALRDRMLRALADAENTRRRAERAAEDARQYAVADFARELLPVTDNLRRAIVTAERHTPKSVEDDALIEGVRATERLLMAAFERFGIRKIDALGARFDPSLHEAVTEVDDASQVPGTVVDVLEEGYTIHDRLLRPARVIIAKRRPDAPSLHPASQSRPDDRRG
jgi:molecular chaperone GrpE